MTENDNLPMHNAFVPGSQGEVSPSLPTQDEEGTNLALVQGSGTIESPCAIEVDMKKLLQPKGKCSLIIRSKDGSVAEMFGPCDSREELILQAAQRGYTLAN